MRRCVAVLGEGLTALSAARILASLKYEAVISPAASATSRRVALNGAAQFLLQRIWGDELLCGLMHHMLERRVLVWSAAEPIVIDEKALVVDTAVLAGRMQDILNRNASIVRSTGGAQSPRLIAVPDSNAARYVTAGRRVAVQANVALTAEADPHALLVEACALGWLALLPVSSQAATLMAVTIEDVSLETILGAAPYTRKAVAGCGVPAPFVQSAPRLRVPEKDSGDYWIGDAAMRFDPLSGDGVAGALRSAHLAALLLMHEDAGAFYYQRLARAFTAHLGGLLNLYQSAPFAGNWAAELHAMRMAQAALPQSGAQLQQFAVRESMLVPIRERIHEASSTSG